VPIIKQILNRDLRSMFCDNFLRRGKDISHIVVQRVAQV